MPILKPSTVNHELPVLYFTIHISVSQRPFIHFLQILSKGGVTYRDEPWHKECFVCTGCKVQLAGTQFTSQDEKPYCIKCFGNLYAKKCFGCTKPITGIINSVTS